MDSSDSLLVLDEAMAEPPAVVSSVNGSTNMDLSRNDYMYTRFEVKVVMFLVFTLVFVTCFVGNSLVVGVVSCQRRMRSATNFFLTNLAVADIMVALFCVYQNLSLYLLDYDWAFGNVLCKLYHFVQALAYTASVLIMVLIALERYVAIVHPITAKRVLRMSNLRIASFVVWTLSIVICSPRLVMFALVEVPTGRPDGQLDRICILQQRLYNQKVYHVFAFVVLFAIPLAVMSFVYSTLGLRLYATDIHDAVGLTRINRKVDRRSSSVTPSGIESSIPSSSKQTSTSNGYSSSSSADDRVARCCRLGVHSRNRTVLANGHSINCLRMDAKISTACTGNKKQRIAETHMSSVMVARRKVLRLLVAVVVAFAICHFPYHFRKLLQDWFPNYNGASNGAIMFTIVTNVVMYANSAINPILYALMSTKFRKSMRDLAICRRGMCCEAIRRRRRRRNHEFSHVKFCVGQPTVKISSNSNKISNLVNRTTKTAVKTI